MMPGRSVVEVSAPALLESVPARRAERAVRQFRSALHKVIPVPAPSCCSLLIEDIAQAATTRPAGSDLWAAVGEDRLCDHAGLPVLKGTLAQAIEWETLKLQSRLGESTSPPTSRPVPLFRDRHVHIGTLIRLWRRLALDTEESLAGQGCDTLLDVGPWGGFNFVLDADGYTRMPFARLTLAIAGLPVTPIQEQGGPIFEHLLPRYHAALEAAGVTFPDVWHYQFPKQDPTGRLAEISGTHYLPDHTYERRTFIKVRVSRAYDTVEEMTLQDFLILLERLQFTTDWDLYREQTKDVDARFDLQDFISLNHLVEGVYQRSASEERLLNEIKDAFRGAIRTPNVLYDFLGRVIRSRWVENLYWAMTEAALGVKRYQRLVSFDREVCPQIPPRLLIPVRRHMQRYHRQLGAFSDSSSLSA